jgi:hypothetical protein
MILTEVNGIIVPKQTGCGCVRQPLAKRLQCPVGFIPFNNSCVSQCEKGYSSITDISGNISSLFCQALCPENPKSQTRWTRINNLCVKNYFSRIQQKKNGSQVYGSYSTPSNTLTYLASKPLGSGLNERSPLGQALLPTSMSPFSPSSWLPSGLNMKTVSLIIGAFILFLFFPFISSIIQSFSHIISGIGSGIGSTIKGAGEGIGGVESAIGKVASGAGSAIQGTLNVIGTAEQNIAKEGLHN